MHGGRITSLRGPDGHEWLWSRDAPGRSVVRPGDAFVDAGGAEECFPTVAGRPDHGAVWSRPFDGTADVGAARFSREIELDGDRARLRYLVTASPGSRFVWAFHALLALTPGLVVEPRSATTVTTWPDGYDRAPVTRPWPSGMDAPGDADGSARFGVLRDESSVTVRAAGRALELALEIGEAPHGFGIWNNRGGFDGGDGVPYRSFGVEPLVGRHPDAALASPADVATVPASGRLGWTLTLRTSRED